MASTEHPGIDANVTLTPKDEPHFNVPALGDRVRIDGHRLRVSLCAS
jgi:hypothetical protein